MAGAAPPDLELSWVDNDLPDEEKIPLCKDAEAIILLPDYVSTNLIVHCPRVRLVQTLAAGYDQLDVKGIMELGIPVANNGGANAIAVAEQTIALMLSVNKKMMVQWHNAVQDRWRGGLSGLELTEITNKTVGILGMGRIGKEVAKRLKGFDTTTIYYDFVEVPHTVQRQLNAQPVSFDELLRRSDILTIHVSLSSQTRGMIGDRELDMMKPAAILINTSRGLVLDERALYQALRNGRIAGAGLDVLEQEPASPDNPLYELENVVITPHMAGYSLECSLRAARFAFSNVQRVLAGEPPESTIVPDA